MRARAPARGRPPGRRAGAHRAPARGRQADRARAHRAAARPGLASRSSTRSSPTAAPTSAWRSSSIPGDGVVTGHGTRRRPAGLRLRPGLHRLRRLAVRDLRREDLQGHGPGDEGRRAGHRPQRLRRRAHPGGRRLARRLRRHLPAQHAGLGRRAADLARSWGPAPAARSTRRRSPTSSSWSSDTSYMFITGPDVIKTVTHEEVTKEELGGADDPQRQERAWRTSRRADDATCLRPIRELLSYLPSEQHGGPAAARRPTIPRTARTRALDTLVPDEPQPALRHQAR